MTCHNEERFIEQAIRSVMSQTALDVLGEVIVVEDGSSDGSRALLDRLAQENPLLKIFSGPEKGVSAARNMAIHLASGTHVAFLDGDDLWANDKLAQQLASINQSSQDTGLWYTDFVEFNDSEPLKGRRVQVRLFPGNAVQTLHDFFIHDGPIIPSTVLVLRQALLDVGGFDERLRYIEDGDLWLRIAAAGHRFQHVPGAMVFKRLHGGNASRDLSRWDGAAEVVTQTWLERCPELKPLRLRRDSFRRSKIAASYLAVGETRRALGMLWRALSDNPLNLRCYAIGLLVIVPRSLRSALMLKLKDFRARVRQIYRADKLA